jgi:hypothetical protein
MATLPMPERAWSRWTRSGPSTSDKQRGARSQNKNSTSGWRRPRTSSKNKAVVAIARKLLVAVWHILSNDGPDRFADPERAARKLLEHANRLGPARRPEGQTAVQYVRYHLDRLGLGAEVTSVPWGKTRRIALPPSQVVAEAN